MSGEGTSQNNSLVDCQVTDCGCLEREHLKTTLSLTVRLQIVDVWRGNISKQHSTEYQVTVTEHLQRGHLKTIVNVNIADIGFVPAIFY